MNNYMELAKEQALIGITGNEGGPFGALITDKDGNIISVSNNRVLKDNDPTAHAEITCIREACKKIKSHDLKDYILYTTCEPCPMCLSAIIWANIETVYYGCTRIDANNIGFRDDKIYNYFEGKEVNLLDLKQVNREECLELFNKYKQDNKQLY